MNADYADLATARTLKERGYPLLESDLVRWYNLSRGGWQLWDRTRRSDYETTDNRVLEEIAAPTLLAILAWLTPEWKWEHTYLLGEDTEIWRAWHYNDDDEIDESVRTDTPAALITAVLEAS